MSTSSPCTQISPTPSKSRSLRKQNGERSWWLRTSPKQVSPSQISYMSSTVERSRRLNSTPTQTCPDWSRHIQGELASRSLSIWHMLTSPDSVGLLLDRGEDELDERSQESVTRFLAVGPKTNSWPASPSRKSSERRWRVCSCRSRAWTRMRTSSNIYCESCRPRYGIRSGLYNHCRTDLQKGYRSSQDRGDGCCLENIAGSRSRRRRSHDVAVDSLGETR